MQKRKAYTEKIIDSAPPKIRKFVRELGLKNIDRIKGRNQWTVKIMWKNVPHHKTFADIHYYGGNKWIALLAALTWRANKNKELGKPDTDRMMRTQHSTTNIGVPGVRIKPGKSGLLVCTYYTYRGKKIGRTFSCNKYGGMDATIKIAIKFREKLVRERGNCIVLL